MFMTKTIKLTDKSNDYYGNCRALIVKGGKMVAMHRVKKGDEFYVTPGGHKEKGEDDYTCCKREVMEESGITDFEVISDGIFDVDVQVIPYSARKNEPEHFHYDVNFLILAHNKNFVLSDESTELAWLTIDEARKRLDKDDVSTRRMLTKYENMLKQ